ncbi:polypyrimidine tract-binding protein homolog 2 isoform X1 [Tanacetum coccineum]
MLAGIHNEVDVTIINQNDQAVHSRLWLKKEKKEIFCTFVYAHNKYNQRRDLWNALCLHKVFVNNRLVSLEISCGTLHLSESTAEFLTNMTFVNDFAGSHAIFKPYRNSDHSPSVLCIPTATKVKPKPFKFFNVLVKHDRFKEVVNEAWNYHVSGFYMFRTVKKLKNLKKPLRKLMIDKGNLSCNVGDEIRGELDTIQTQLDIDPFNIRLREIEAANVVAFNQAVLDEEMFLKQKAKISWLKDGDSNTAYFHKSVKSRVSRSRIDVISNSDGIIFAMTNFCRIALVAHTKLFSLTITGYTNGFDGSNLFSNCLDEQGAAHMVMVTDREIKEAMFSMGDEYPRGPMGSLLRFSKKLGILWVLMSLMLSVNFLRMSAFIPGRSIADNILLTQELMHNYHLDRGPPRCAFKVDIQKAYDTVDWAFLKSVLMGFGFHERMIAWIMECVSSTSYSICINGNLHGYFQGKRGLRQGDPLSPYLFTLVMEVVVYQGNVLTNSKHASGLIHSIRKCTAFLCNVLNHVKLSILNVLPFEEGRLPVKYLGVPLVSSRLKARDCKELVEKVQNRVLDWKNKALSIAGKAKVAWELVCLPKDEGGLGIRRLEPFNSALLVSHIWNLLSLKEFMCCAGFQRILFGKSVTGGFLRSREGYIDQVVSCISSSVRMKLLSCAFKRTTEGVLYAKVMGLYLFYLR